MQSTPNIPETGTSDRSRRDDQASQTIELLEEVLRISKREVETGRVRVSLVTEVEQRTVEEQLATRTIEVDRVPVGRQLQPGEEVPQSRTEGNLLIVPVIEEVLVVEKRLVIKEELRIRIVQGHEAVSHVVPLRRQRATVERVGPDATATEGLGP